MATVPPTKNTEQKSSGRSCLTVVALFLVYLLLSAILLILPTGFIGPVFAMGGLLLVGVIGFHYLLWGRWMSRLLQEKEDREDHPG
jgi:hypothetical protein